MAKLLLSDNGGDNRIAITLIFAKYPQLYNYAVNWHIGHPEKVVFFDCVEGIFPIHELVKHKIVGIVIPEYL